MLKEENKMFKIAPILCSEPASAIVEPVCLTLSPLLQPDRDLRSPSLENPRTVSEAKLTVGGHSQARLSNAAILEARLCVLSNVIFSRWPFSLAAGPKQR